MTGPVQAEWVALMADIDQANRKAAAFLERTRESTASAEGRRET
jgi:hypothetical protein